MKVFTINLFIYIYELHIMVLFKYFIHKALWNFPWKLIGLNLWKISPANLSVIAVYRFCDTDKYLHVISRFSNQSKTEQQMCNSTILCNTIGMDDILMLILQAKLIITHPCIIIVQYNVKLHTILHWTFPIGTYQLMYSHIVILPL